MITVVLNGYKRGNNLNEQLEALERQTVKPTEILLWYNSPDDDTEINYEIGTKIPVAYSNYNCNHNLFIVSFNQTSFV